MNCQRFFDIILQKSKNLVYYPRGDIMDKSLVNALKFGRRKEHLTQEDVAKQLNVKKNTISNYENGISEPDIDTFCKLCKIYKIDVSKLLGELCGVRLFYNDFVMKPSEIDFLLNYRKLNKTGQEHLNYEMNKELEHLYLLQEKDSKIEQANRNSQKFLNIPCFSEISCTKLGEYIFDKLPAKTLCVPTTDISLQANFILELGETNLTMLPAFKPHDLIYVKQTKTLSKGDIGIFINIQYDIPKNSSYFLGEFQDSEIIRYNNDYSNIFFTNSIRIIGKVLGKVE